MVEKKGSFSFFFFTRLFEAETAFFKGVFFIGGALEYEYVCYRHFGLQKRA